MSRPRVLAFDSGVGGLSVVDALIAAGLPIDLDYLADDAWLPYGAKDESLLKARIPKLLGAVADAFAADLVIVACNTATTLALEAVRARIAAPVVGVVPPIKPAAEASRSRVVGLLATPTTLARPATKDLIAAFAKDCAIVPVGSTALVAAAEAKLAGGAVPHAAIEEAIAALFAGPTGARLDVVALACTHFPHLADELAAAAPRPVLWLDSGAAIARRVASLLDLQPGGGAVRLRRAGFTGAVSSRAPFSLRGFSSSFQVDARFVVSPTGAAFG